MSEKVEVDVTGRSKYEVAESMAIRILLSIEGKRWNEISREEYLRAVSQSIEALQGIEP